MRKKTPHLKVAIDLGASATKAIGSVETDGEINYFPILMTPHYLKVENGSLAPDPGFDENSTWIELGGDSYVVGRFAVTRYRDDIKVRPAKATSAIPKIWSVIALFHQKFNLTAKFNVSVVFVLPPAEWEQRVILTEKLKSFEAIATPNGTISPTLVNVISYPEGMGILLGQGVNLRTAGLITTVMLGFRNASILTSSYGKIDRSQTSDLGFHNLLMDVTSKTGYKLEDTIQPVFEYRQAQFKLAKATKDLAEHTYTMDRAGYGTPTRQNCVDSIERDRQQIAKSTLIIQHCFDPLLRCTESDREVEREMMIKSIDRATETYVRRLSGWLDEVLPTQLDRICLCGGTANYLGTELDAFLINKLKSRDKKDLSLHSQLTIPTAIKQRVDADRFADIYSLWHQLTNPVAVTK
jgi:Actin like proteins N terminal domain